LIAAPNVSPTTLKKPSSPPIRSEYSWVVLCPSLASVRLTKRASHAIPEFVRMVELRLLLALILVLLGATVVVDLSLGDDADTMALQGQTQPLRVNLDEKTPASVGRPSPALDSSRTNPDIAPRSCVSVIDLACVLRC
jgi:hypothetical protein